ncbi:hypothetical protein KTT66_06235 [Lacticaseibacillus casei]|uniref:hypothetical protein n=1 Tax=Lacticaseibacillus TaxID=2759736 RepID=UPI000A61BE00|nr:MULTISPECIES: hypothetical protein [Lacticaseibacillus]QVI38659.1 hypothetical protein KGS74_07000 [Lacticaseibacillus casei]QXG60386.1 hypothetical protein KTT66_06235 [Lacticaseibacillus casei]WFB42463.1 hypothetical protein LHUE2_000442 [Lacticaseibacillus huelsenbergensis]
MVLQLSNHIPTKGGAGLSVIDAFAAVTAGLGSAIVMVNVFTRLIKALEKLCDAVYELKQALGKFREK